MDGIVTIATAGLPVLLLTAAARLADETAGREAGADAHLTKPFTAGDLVARVRELIAARAEQPGPRP